jgi:hypothetical protein
MTSTDQLILINSHSNTINKYNPDLTLANSITIPISPPFNIDQTNDQIAITTNKSPISILIYNKNLELIYQNSFHITDYFITSKLLKSMQLLLVLLNSMKIIDLTTSTQKQIQQYDAFTIPNTFSVLEMYDKYFVFIVQCDRYKKLYQLDDKLIETKIPWTLPHPDDYFKRAPITIGISNNQYRFLCVYEIGEQYIFYILYGDTHEEITFPKISIHTPMNYHYDTYSDSLMILTISENKYVLYLLKEGENRKWRLINMNVYKITFNTYWKSTVYTSYDNIIIDSANILIINKYNLQIVHQINNEKNEYTVLTDSIWPEQLLQLMTDHPALNKLSRSLLTLILSYLKI